MSSNETKRVLLSEQFVDDLFYTANVTIARTEVVFNAETVVFVKLANDTEPVTLSLPMCDIDTFLAAYTAYQRIQQAERALQDPDAFRAWLVTRRDQKHSIGSRSTGLHNPLALWLSDLYGKPYRAGSRGYGADGTEEDLGTLWWMQAFMDKVCADSDTPTLHPCVETPDLDPSYALSVLDALLASVDNLDEHPF